MFEVPNYLELVDCTEDLSDCEVYRGSVPIAMGDLTDPEYLSRQARSFELMREKLCGECVDLVGLFLKMDQLVEFNKLILEE